MTNEAKIVRAGTTTTVLSLAAALTNAQNTYEGMTSLTMNALDNSTLNYPYAEAVLDCPDTFAAAPTAGGGVELWMCKQDVDSTNDVIPAPDSNSDTKAATYVGFFPIPALDVAQRVAIVISLEGVKSARYYIKNSCGQNISYTSNPITVKITPFSYGPT